MIIATTFKNYNGVSLEIHFDINYENISYSITSRYKDICKKLYFDSFNNACRCYKALSKKIEIN